MALNQCVGNSTTHRPILGSVVLLMALTDPVQSPSQISRMSAVPSLGLRAQEGTKEKDHLCEVHNRKMNGYHFPSTYFKHFTCVNAFNPP